MKLSIFPEVTSPLPKSKDEKKEQAKFASRPYLPEVAEVANEDDLLEIVTSFAWSPFVFKKARLQEDFVSTDFLVLDIDSGLTIEEAEKRVEEANMTCLCVPSTSHSTEAHRFRLIFPLSRTITKIEEFLASMSDLYESFSEADPSCVTDSARYYFAHTKDDGYWFEGELLEPTEVKVIEKEVNKFGRADLSKTVKVDLDTEEIVKELYGEDRLTIPEAVDFFIKNAHTGLEGNWTVSLNRFVFVLSLQGIDDDTIIDLVEYLAPNSLDKTDQNTIKYALRDGKKSREEE